MERMVSHEDLTAVLVTELSLEFAEEVEFADEHARNVTMSIIDALTRQGWFVARGEVG